MVKPITKRLIKKKEPKNQAAMIYLSFPSYSYGTLSSKEASLLRICFHKLKLQNMLINIQENNTKQISRIT